MKILRIKIKDDAPVVSIGQDYLNAKEGDFGYFTVNVSGQVPEKGLYIDYSIESSSSATEEEDFYAPMAYFPLSYSKESPIPIRSIYIPYGQSTAKVYISAIDDAIHEKYESVDIQLKERTNSADLRFTGLKMATNQTSKR